MPDRKQGIEKAVDLIGLADVLAQELADTHVQGRPALADAPFEKIVCALDAATREFRQYAVSECETDLV